MDQNERDDHIGKLAVSMLKTMPRLYRSAIKKNDMPDGCNIAYPKIGILVTLKIEGPLPLSVLAKRHSYSRQNLTSLTDRLEADGLVKRCPDPNDRRITNLELTDAGRAYIREKGLQMKQALVKDLECLNDMDIEALLESFKTIERCYLKIAEAQDRDDTQ